MGAPDSEPSGPARGEHPEPPDRDEDEPAEESLAAGGQLQVHVVAEADQQLAEHRHHAHPRLAQGQLVHGVLAQPGVNLTQIACGQLFVFIFTEPVLEDECSGVSRGDPISNITIGVEFLDI